MQRAYIVPPTLLKPNLLKPLHRLIASSGGNSAFTSFPRQRQSRTRKFG
jgi:hypothetical protein